MMPVQMHGTFFGDVEKMLARALYDAGQSDRDIADAVSTSVNNILHWRRESGLPENGSRTATTLYDAGQSDRDIAAPVPASGRNPSARSDLPGATPLPAPGRTSNSLELGTGIGGAKIAVDLEELLTTRLLIQGNSGSGKSHLLRKLLEEATGIIQQIVIDPEGDFASFETFGHVIIDAEKQGLARMVTLARRVREKRASAVLNLEGFDPEQQMQAVGLFLTGLFDAPQEHWFPALVAVDEAQLFAPTADNGEDREVRKASLTAMTNLMCRGRKRGLAGILATQRVAKLHKNVASEASNFLVGRTFMDIDINRAADLIGLPTREARMIRDLNRGEFIGLGPAIARLSTKVKVGATITQGKAGAKGLVDLPSVSPEEMNDLILAPDPEEDASPMPALRVVK